MAAEHRGVKQRVAEKAKYRKERQEWQGFLAFCF
jgi:hypothetical protein